MGREYVKDGILCSAIIFSFTKIPRMLFLNVIQGCVSLGELGNNELVMMHKKVVMTSLICGTTEEYKEETQGQDFQSEITKILIRNSNHLALSFNHKCVRQQILAT